MMKNKFKNILLVLVIHILFMNTLFAASRVDLALEDDAHFMLDSIAQKKAEMTQLASDLKNVEMHLAKRKGQSVYLKFENIAGTLVIVSVVVGSYVARFPPGWRAMLSAYTTVIGMNRGMIKLSEKDMHIFNRQVSLLKERLKIANEKLDKQADPRKTWTCINS